jgi:eukaryotic-like serine/threonine-protein kinase
MGWDMALQGSQLLVLWAIEESPKDLSGHVSDEQVSRLTLIPINDVRDWLETLEEKELVNISRTTKGFLVYTTASGRLELGRYQGERLDNKQVEDHYQRLLKARPTELLLLRDKLKPYREALAERLWMVLEQSEQEEEYLQAASALALYDPANPRWQTVNGKVALAIVTVNVAHLGTWLDALRPARDKLVAPLASIYRDLERPGTERSLTLGILEDYASDQPNVLTDLLLGSEEEHFAGLFEKLKVHQEIVVPLLKGEMGDLIPEAGKNQKDDLTKRQARAAIALVRLGQADEVWRKLHHSPDPRLRSYIVNWLAPLGADPRQIASELERIVAVLKPVPAKNQQVMDAVLFNPETSKRRALILALGQYRMDRFSPSEREPLIAELFDLYRNDPDAGIHGAAEWTLRHWGQEEALRTVVAELQGLKDWGDRRWYVNSEGQTFVVIEGPVEFMMGSPITDPDRNSEETPHRQPINRRFAIATKEVTVEQYERFRPRGIDSYSTDPEGPINWASWYDAAAYCNWLSEREALDKTQWCYETNPDGEYDEGMKIVPDFLECSGYRLPTEAEWEYACRAGTITSRYYGDSLELLGQYAWHAENSMNKAWPCGQVMPNDLGLFDMLGNMYEWCLDAYSPYSQDDLKQTSASISLYGLIKSATNRLLRGGTFNDLPGSARSAFRLGVTPLITLGNFGFRLARTYP